MGETEFEELDWDAASSLVPVDVVIMTAVKVELTAVRARLRPPSGRTKVVRMIYRESTYYLGDLGGRRCALSMSDAGTGGRDGSALALNDAITRLRPAFAIAVGIAFGKDASKQLIGDVLVSTQVIPYENERRGVTEDIPRSPQPEAGQVLLNRARHLDIDEPTLRMRFGPLLSGEKLVDDPVFKAELFSRHPSAIGGEMEAAGIYAASSRHRLEWLVMKGICDWADGKKNDEHQKLAAEMAAVALERFLARKGLERQQFEPYDRTPVVTDLERKAGPALAQIFKEGKAHTQKLAFEAAAAGIRQADRARAEATQRLHAVLETFRKKDDGKITPPTSPAEEEVVRRVVGPLAAAREAALEAWLNAYNDASVRYVDGSLDRSLFEEAFGQEIRELIEIEGPQSPRLHPRTSSSYNSIWTAYDQLPAKPMPAVVPPPDARLGASVDAANEEKASLPRDLAADDPLAISLRTARDSFASRAGEARTKHGVSSYMLVELTPRAGTFPDLSHARMKEIVGRSRVILQSSEFMYPWLVEWMPNRTDVVEAVSARDFPGMMMMMHRSGGFVVERTFTEDLHWPGSGFLVPGRLVREVATGVLFARNMVDALDLGAVELGFAIVGANQRHFRFDVESYRVQRPYGATEETVRERKRLTASSLKQEPLAIAKTMSESLLSLFNFENSEGLIADVLEPIEKLQ